MKKDLLKVKGQIKKIHLKQKGLEEENYTRVIEVLNKNLEPDSFQTLSSDHVLSFNNEVSHYLNSFLANNVLTKPYYCNWKNITALLDEFLQFKKSSFIIYSLYPAKFPIVIVDYSNIHLPLEALFNLFEREIAIISADYNDALFIREDFSTEQPYRIELHGFEVNKLIKTQLKDVISCPVK